MNSAFVVVDNMGRTKLADLLNLYGLSVLACEDESQLRRRVKDHVEVGTIPVDEIYQTA